jgi:VIT1/CCC1 family predicted Fe2+/Mn2+ transporter
MSNAVNTVSEDSGVRRLPRAPRAKAVVAVEAAPESVPALPVRAPRAPRAPRAAKVVDTGVVAQVRTAFADKNRLATFAGFLLGGLVPMATFFVAHFEVTGLLDPRALLVLGGLLFSAKTVYSWSRLAFQNASKALGFVVLVEGVMIFSATAWLSWVCLGYLVVINGIATGCLLSKGNKEEA